MELKIGNVNVTALAKKYGTPLYVYDEAMLNHIMKQYKDNLKSNKFKTNILFASKAFSCVEIYKLVQKNGLGADVVSGGEIYTALKASFDPKMMYFHGNNKQSYEVRYALENKIINMVVDNFDELKLLNDIANDMAIDVNVLFRLNVGVEAHTHKFIVTANIDSKFGMLFDSDELKKCLEFVSKSKHLKLKGFHSHIGSQIFEINAFYAAIDKLIKFYQGFKEELVLNIGGGFGVKYTDEDSPISIDKLCQMLINHIEEELAKNNVKISELIIEPGRSIVGESGYTLYTIGNMKVTPHRKYYFIDGGMADNIRPALYQAKYDCDIANKMELPKTEKVCIAGKCCESGDIIIEDCMLPKAERGDILVTYTTGAYGYTMSSHYNKALTPAIVFVNNAKARLVLRRETYDDLVDCDVVTNYDEF